MKTNRTKSLFLALAIMTAQSAFAGPLQDLKIAVEPDSLVQVEVDCFAVGQDKAAELGGELAKASPGTVDGVPVCHLVVLVPGKDGARPKRVAIDIPQ
jgi:hypothetical protein